VSNPLVAQARSSTTWYTGLGLVEDAAQISSGIQNNSWVDGTLGTAGGTLDILGMAIDPIGSLAAWGVSWLMEHVKPLKDALDWLAGNPDEISAHAVTWENVATFTLDAQHAFSDAIKAETAGWVGASGDAYREHAGTHLTVMEGISKAAHGIHYGVLGAGLLVGLVRGIVRDLIAQFIATLAARLPQWLAEAGLTLGIGTPVVIGQVAALVATWVNKIQGFLRGLFNSLRKLIPMLNKLGDILTRLKDLLRKLAHSNPLTRSADDVDAPRTHEGGWSGARYVDEVDPPTALAYEHIRADTGDVGAIAGNLEVNPSIVDRVKQHLFLDEHDIPTGPAQVGHGNFTPDARVADLWSKARNGALHADEAAEFRRLLSHEYVESNLMEQGLPYRSSDPGAYDTDGLNWPTAQHHGAHDLAPLVNHQRDPFAHWPSLGRTPPDITIADDLSNLDDVVRLIQGG
jgi:hypothetical protein